MVVLGFCKEAGRGSCGGTSEESKNCRKHGSRGVAVSIVLGQVAACVDDRLDVPLHSLECFLYEALGQGQGTLLEALKVGVLRLGSLGRL